MAHDPLAVLGMTHRNSEQDSPAVYPDEADGCTYSHELGGIHPTINTYKYALERHST
jgi:hypothetical protein